jgi:hypothetical protein
MPNTAIQQLITSAFGSLAHPLAPWYAEYAASSAALQSFISANTTKIRKKVRHATDAEALRDLRCELAIAAALVDRRSVLSYEPLAASNRRGPDFLLHYKGHTTIYVEVSRLRASAQTERDPIERLAGVLCGKLSQFVAGSANLFVLISDEGSYSNETVTATLQLLRQRANARDDAYFAFRGLTDARMLHQTLPRLSAILIVAPTSLTETWFVYTQGRFALPAEFARGVPNWKLAPIIGSVAG